MLHASLLCRRRFIVVLKPPKTRRSVVCFSTPNSVWVTGNIRFLHPAAVLYNTDKMTWGVIPIFRTRCWTRRYFNMYSITYLNEISTFATSPHREPKSVVKSATILHFMSLAHMQGSRTHWPHFEPILQGWLKTGKTHSVGIQQAVELHGFSTVVGGVTTPTMKHNLGGLLTIMYVLTVIMHHGRWSVGISAVVEIIIMLINRSFGDTVVVSCV